MEDSQVHLSVVVEIAHCHGPGAGHSRIKVHCRLERAIAISKQNADIPATGIGHGNVQLAVSVEVADGDSGRGGPYRVALRA